MLALPSLIIYTFSVFSTDLTWYQSHPSKIIYSNKVFLWWSSPSRCSWVCAGNVQACA